jgi:uncharacterized protein YcfJ
MSICKKNILCCAVCVLFCPLSVHCADSSAIIGGLIGGATGAVIGSELGGRDGAVIGAGIGAMTGVSIAQSSDEEDSYPRHYRTSQSPVYYAPQVIEIHEYPPPRHYQRVYRQEYYAPPRYYHRTYRQNYEPYYDHRVNRRY